jgi:phytoene dehydrogenase-like protein
MRERAQRFQYNLLAPLFALHLNLAEPPRYRASAERGELARAFMVILGLDHVDQFADIVRHHEAGTIPPTVMWGACPTLFDPSQAPEGRHTAFMWEKLPYRVHGDARNWERLRDAHGRAMLKLWQQHAPNLADAVIDSFATPADTARDLPNMRAGDLLVGAFANDQVGYHRPFAGAGNYRTHLPGLYLCGASSHPGGNIECASRVYPTCVVKPGGDGVVRMLAWCLLKYRRRQREGAERDGRDGSGDRGGASLGRGEPRGHGRARLRAHPRAR